LFKDIGEQITAHGFGGVNRYRGSAAIFVVEDGVAAFLPHVFKSQRLKPFDDLSCF
jgi:hypothetical protein